MWTAVIQNGLVFGGWLSVLMSLMLVVVGLINPAMMLRSYPSDVRAKYGAASERANRQRKVLMPFFLLAMAVLFIVSVTSLKQAVGVLTFGDVFLSTLITVLIFNVYDLLIIDWLIMVGLKPKFAILPGTEGLAGYQSYAYHFRGFLIGLIWSVGLALIVAAVAVLLG